MPTSNKHICCFLTQFRSGYYILFVSINFLEAFGDLVICKLSHCSASVDGGLEMILLCEKVAKGKHF